MEVLEGHGKELQIWITSAMSSNESDITDEEQTLIYTKIAFLSHCLSTLVNNSTLYADKMMTLINSGNDIQMDQKTEQFNFDGEYKFFRCVQIIF